MGRDTTLLQGDVKDSNQGVRREGSAALRPPAATPHNTCDALPAAGLLCSVFKPHLLLTPYQHVAVTSPPNIQAHTLSEPAMASNGRIWNNRHVLALLVSTEYISSTLTQR